MEGRRSWKAAFLLGSLRLAPAHLEAVETRADIGSRALRDDLSQLNSLNLGSLLPGALNETASHVVHHSDTSWFGLVYGVPMLFARSASLDSQLPILRQWLLETGEPRWRQLPEDPRWPVVSERSQLTTKYTRYNALGEALRDESQKVRKVAETLRKFLLENLAQIMSRFPEAIAAMPNRKVRSQWKRRLRTVGLEAAGKSWPVGVHVQSWMNAHRSDVEGERGLEMHDHQVGWHGYYLVDSAPSNTSYLTPRSAAASSFSERDGEGNSRDSKRKDVPQQVLFTLNNTDGVFVLLCGGVRHGVLQNADGRAFRGKRPRISMAFDFALSSRHGEIAITHPNSIFGSEAERRAGVRHLDESGKTNTWMQLASADELQQALGHKPVLAFDYQSLDKHYSDKVHRATSATWGGMVQLGSLVGDVGSSGGIAEVPTASSTAGEEL